LNFGNRERRVFGASAARTLPDVNQSIFVTVDERFQQHAAHDAKNGRVGAYAQGQSEHDRSGQALGSCERAESKLDVLQEGHAGLARA
jgi:hypothetical protein